MHRDRSICRSRGCRLSSAGEARGGGCRSADQHGVGRWVGRGGAGLVEGGGGASSWWAWGPGRRHATRRGRRGARFARSCGVGSRPLRRGRGAACGGGRRGAGSGHGSVRGTGGTTVLAARAMGARGRSRGRDRPAVRGRGRCRGALGDHRPLTAMPLPARGRERPEFAFFWPPGILPAAASAVLVPRCMVSMTEAVRQGVFECGARRWCGSSRRLPCIDDVKGLLWPQHGRGDVASSSASWPSWL